MTAILALSAAVVYGTADFFGGVAARRTSPMAVTLSAHVVGLILLMVAIPVLPTAHPQLSDLLYGGVAGAFGAGGLILFYRALSRGTMSVVAPVAALFGAALPVVVGVGLGEQLSVPALVGIGVAIVAVALVSREGEPAELRSHGPGGHPLVLAVIAGAAFGSFFILLSRTHASAGLWPLLSARVVSVALLAAVTLLSGRSLRPTPGSRRLVVAAGAGDMVANVLYLLAVRRGLVSLVAVIVALYPAATVLLAQVVLGERLRRIQIGGLALAAGAATLLALA
ncbi:MAG TPA: EamA family transporter [Acidimicrobiales bacterium]